MTDADLVPPDESTGANGSPNGREVPIEPLAPTTTPPQASGQHSATQGVSAEAQLLPSVVEPEPETRPTVLVHPDAPLADAAAIEEHECTWFEDEALRSSSRSDIKRPCGHWLRSDGARICGAHPLSPKGPCRQTSLYDNGRCHHHGGPTPRGMAAGSYKHGRWSKVLSPTRSKLYEAARDDPELLDLRRTIGALDAGVSEAMKRREKLDTPNFRDAAIELFAEVQVQMKTDPEAAAQSMAALGRLLRQGSKEDDANEEVARHVSRMSKHMETAWKIRLGAAHSVNDSDLLAIIGAFIDVIVREVPKEYVGPILAGFDREVLRGRLAQSGVDTTLR